MTAEMRDAIRREIDARKRAQMFTTAANGYTILKREYRPNRTIPSVAGKVNGIKHSTWGYKNHGCRCDVCCEAISRHNRTRWERRRAA